MKKLILMVIVFLIFQSCRTIVINVSCDCKKEELKFKPGLSDGNIYPSYPINFIPFDEGILIQNNPFISYQKKVKK